MYPNEIYDRLTLQESDVTGLDNDDQFTEYEVEVYENGRLELKDGGLIGVDEASEFKPIPGKKVRLYGRGFGYVVRGITVETPEGWKTVRYRTPKQSAEDHWDWCREQEKQREEEYEKNKEAIETRIAALPEVLQSRLAYFRRTEPRFVFDGEPYELYIYEQATVFAAALGSVEAIDEFREMSFDEQKRIIQEKVGDILAEEFESHSGNTFGCACGFAKYLLSDPEKIRLPKEE